jgi:hypothetical protein
MVNLAIVVPLQWIENVRGFAPLSESAPSLPPSLPRCSDNDHKKIDRIGTKE